MQVTTFQRGNKKNAHLKTPEHNIINNEQTNRN